MSGRQNVRSTFNCGKTELFLSVSFALSLCVADHSEGMGHPLSPKRYGVGSSRMNYFEVLENFHGARSPLSLWPFLPSNLAKLILPPNEFAPSILYIVVAHLPGHAGLYVVWYSLRDSSYQREKKYLEERLIRRRARERLSVVYALFVVGKSKYRHVYG